MLLRCVVPKDKGRAGRVSPPDGIAKFGGNIRICPVAEINDGYIDVIIMQMPGSPEGLPDREV